MAGYNRIIIVGNLTRDPEYKELTSGQAICRLGLASNRQYKNRQTGSMVQEVCYVDVDVWGPQANSCKQYLQKGKAALVEGRLKFDSWKDAEGQTRSKHIIVADRVVFLSSPASVSDMDLSESEEKIEPRNQLEKDVLDQIEELKSRSAAGASVQRKSKKQFLANETAPVDLMPAGEVDFKDEPPFQDELPF